MRIKFLSVIVSFLAISFAMSSCLDNDNTIEYGTDPTIHSFSISDIETDSLIKNGNYNGTEDTTIVIKLTGADYPFTIDQLSVGSFDYDDGDEVKKGTYTGTIFNKDSLPVGTDIKKVVISMSVNGYVTYNRKNISGKDSLCLWSNTDSLDFTNPIYFSVYAQDPTLAPKIYQAKINVHKQYPDSLEWKNVPANFPIIAGKQKAVYMNEVIYVFAKNDSKLYITKSNNGTNWEEVNIETSNVSLNADYSSAVTYSNKLFIVAGGKIYSSGDGENWSEVPNTEGIKTLIGAFNSDKNKRLLGIKGNKLIQTTDGVNWIEATKELPSGFPTENFAVAPAYPLKTNNSIERMILVSNQPDKAVNDTASVVWALASDKDEWVMYSPETNNKYSCPLFENIGIIRYNEQLYTFGGATKGLKAFQSFYASQDNGLVWKEETRFVRFPKEFLGRNNAFSYIVDKDNFIWIMWSNSGEVWRGRINKMGFVNKI